MQQYHDLIMDILDNGNERDDRTGVGTRSVFGRQLRFDLQAGFPLLTTRKIHWRSVVAELLWMLSGETNVRPLQAQGVTIWDEWANEYGDLGPVYGEQWRHWGYDSAWDGGDHDQIAAVIDQIRTDPTSRRLIVSAWNVEELPFMALPPCHVLFQFYVADGRLSCQLYQRSADVFIGLPYNIASYALLTHMIAQVCGLGVGELVISIGDAHLYRNHEEQAHELLTRWHQPAPTLTLNPEIVNIDAFTADDISLVGYQYHPAIKAPVAI